MEEGTVVPLPRPGATLADDPLLTVLREGARRMLTQAVEAEVEGFLAAHADLTAGQGRRRLGRHGHAPGGPAGVGAAPAARGSGPSRRESARSRSAGRGCATAAGTARGRSASPRPS